MDDWKKKVKDAQKENKEGHEFYGRRQIGMWTELLTKAEKSFEEHIKTYYESP